LLFIIYPPQCIRDVRVFRELLLVTSLKIYIYRYFESFLFPFL
jgi:hypothetical protein